MPGAVRRGAAHSPGAAGTGLHTLPGFWGPGVLPAAGADSVRTMRTLSSRACLERKCEV